MRFLSLYDLWRKAERNRCVCVWRGGKKEQGIVRWALTSRLWLKGGAAGGKRGWWHSQGALTEAPPLSFSLLSSSSTFAWPTLEGYNVTARSLLFTPRYRRAHQLSSLLSARLAHFSPSARQQARFRPPKIAARPRFFQTRVDPKAGCRNPHTFVAPTEMIRISRESDIQESEARRLASQ